MSIYPHSHRIPNSLCLHYVLRTSDGYFLMIHRSKTVAYEVDRVSFSGEEQFKPEDLAVDGFNTFDACVLRAVMEEVYPRLGFGLNSNQGKDILGRIDFARCMSFFLEEKFGNYSLLAYIQLKDDSAIFRAAFRESLKNSEFRADREGTRYLASEEDLKKFLKLGSMRIKVLIVTEN